jgi:starch-binding outer membrane protein, SusD/RagB family
MNKLINIKNLLLTVCIAIVATSCVNDLNVTPINPQVTQIFNQDEVFAKAYAAFSLTGQQGPAGNIDIDTEITDEGKSALYRCLWNCNELTTDEAICCWGDVEVIELNTNSWSSSNPTSGSIYDRFYFVISICNHFLEQTAALTDNATIKQRAEIRYLRALSYYYLMDLFGNVPFTEKISLTPPKQIKRIDLFKWIEKELLAIEPDMYAPKTAPYYRLDKVADWLLLSRLYLNAEVYTTIPATPATANFPAATATAGVPRWDDAALYAKKVIDPSSGYTLCPKFKQLFMGDNAGTLDGSSVNTAPQEIIFPIAADGIKTNSYGSSLFLVGSTHTAGMADWGCSKQGWGGNRSRASLVKKFFPTGTTFFTDGADLTTAILAAYKDSRALFDKKSISYGFTINTIGIFKDGYQVIKFNNLRADGKAPHSIEFTDMDIPFMRAAEAYLTYAEAVTKGAATIGGYTALQAVNALRTRAGATQFASLTTQNIIDEWGREFFFEGRRRSDLIRFGQFGGTTTYKWDWKGGVASGIDFKAEFNLFPIPAGDLNANPNLDQNPGY